MMKNKPETEDKFICYGTYKTSSIRCLIFCPFRSKCEDVTLSNKILKEWKKMMKEKQNG